MFGINGGEFLVIVVVALIIVGPERLPQYVGQFRDTVVRLRDVVRQGQTSVSQEFGRDIDWRVMDPRQYDPRYIVKDAFFGDDAPPVTTRPTGPAHRSSDPVPPSSTPVDYDAT